MNDKIINDLEFYTFVNNLIEENKHLKKIIQKKNNIFKKLDLGNLIKDVKHTIKEREKEEEEKVLVKCMNDFTNGVFKEYRETKER
jgi:hypothetical protein